MWRKLERVSCPLFATLCTLSPLPPPDARHVWYCTHHHRANKGQDNVRGDTPQGQQAEQRVGNGGGEDIEHSPGHGTGLGEALAEGRAACSNDGGGGLGVRRGGGILVSSSHAFTVSICVYLYPERKAVVMYRYWLYNMEMESKSKETGNVPGWIDGRACFGGGSLCMANRSLQTRYTHAGRPRFKVMKNSGK